MNREDLRRFADGIAQIATVCLAAAALFVLVSETRSALPSLPEAKPVGIPTRERADFMSRLDAARIAVDSNQEADEVLSRLKEGFAGRHEVWALSARYHEARQRWGAAIRDYAFAVRLEPAYMDEGSLLYLGERIESLVERRTDALVAEKSRRRLEPDEKAELKAAYFLKRRLAGGCE